MTLLLRPRTLILGCLAGLLAPAAHAACTTGSTLIRVPEDCATVATAVTELANGGTIDIAAGTYTFGSGPLNLSGKNKAMTLKARATGAVTFSGQSLYPVVKISNSTTNGRPIVFEGIRFANGYSTLGLQAGGVSLKNAEATFADCSFENNRNVEVTTGGGGLGLYGGSRALVVRTTFSGNSAKNQGGAIYALNNGTVGPVSLWIYQSTFLDNTTALSGFTGTAAGGAIYLLDTKLHVADSTFEGNEAGWVGGAIYAWGHMSTTAPYCDFDNAPASDMVITRSSFTGNVATDSAGESTVPQTQGGAIHAENCVRLRIYSSLFEDNGADWGGAVSADHAQLTIDQSVLRYNYSTTPSAADGYPIGGAVLSLALDFEADNHPAGATTISRTLFQGGRVGSPSAANSQVGGCLKMLGDSTKAVPIPADARTVVTVTDSAFIDCRASNLVNLQFVGGGAIDLDRSALTVSNTLFARSVATSSATGDDGFGSGIAVRDDARVTYGSNVVFSGGTTDGPYGDVYIGYFAAASGSFTSWTSTQSSPVGGIAVAAPSRPLVGGPFVADAQVSWAYSGTSATLDGAALPTNPKNGSETEIEGVHALVVSGLASCSRCSTTVVAPVHPATTLSASPASISAGGSSTLSWTTPDGTFLAAMTDRGLGEQSATGSTSVSPTSSSTYRRLLISREGGALAEERVYVGEPAPPDNTLFGDGFESGSPNGWSAVSG